VITKWKMIRANLWAAAVMTLGAPGLVISTSGHNPHPRGNGGGASKPGEVGADLSEQGLGDTDPATGNLSSDRRQRRASVPTADLRP